MNIDKLEAHIKEKLHDIMSRRQSQPSSKSDTETERKLMKDDRKLSKTDLESIGELDYHKNVVVDNMTSDSNLTRALYDDILYKIYIQVCWEKYLKKKFKCVVPTSPEIYHQICYEIWEYLEIISNNLINKCRVWRTGIWG